VGLGQKTRLKPLNKWKKKFRPAPYMLKAHGWGA